MKTLLTIMVLAALAALAVPAVAQQTATFGWDGAGVLALGYFGTPVDGDYPILASLEDGTNVPVYNGSHSLMCVDHAPSGTPQLFAAFVHNLRPGDEVHGQVARYDDTPDASPSGRIWGHWNDSLGEPFEDINQYDGSASGQGDYGLGLGWDITEFIWVVPEDHQGLVIELRTYSSPGDTVWFDDLTITAPDHAFIRFPGDDPVAADNTTLTEVKALFD